MTPLLFKKIVVERSKLWAPLSASHNLLVPNQVHGDHIVTVTSNGADDLEAVREQIAEGCDAIVCTAHDVPVLLCFADCVPVVLVAPGGFAVVHSGWKGTIARISAKACQALCDAAGCDASDVSAYIGPHILADEYEVSQELMDRFAVEFSCIECECLSHARSFRCHL